MCVIWWFRIKHIKTRGELKRRGKQMLHGNLCKKLNYSPQTLDFTEFSFK